MPVKHITIVVGQTRIIRAYPVENPIFNLPQEKAARKVMADCQRDLAIEADRRAAIPVTVRG